MDYCLSQTKNNSEQSSLCSDVPGAEGLEVASQPLLRYPKRACRLPARPFRPLRQPRLASSVAGGASAELPGTLRVFGFELN